MRAEAGLARVPTTAESLRQHAIAFVSGGLLTATRLVAGVVRVKYLALQLGTAGVGLLSQAAQAQLLLVSLGSLSLTRGLITRMGALDAQGEPGRESRLLATVLTIQLAASLVLMALSLGASPFLLEQFFPGEAMGAESYLPLIVLSVPLSVVATGYAEGILVGAHRYDLYVRSSIITAILGAAATIIGVTWWGLGGAMAAILATSALHAASATAYAVRVRSLGQMFRLGFEAAEAALMIRFCFVMLAVAAASYLSRLWIQSEVIGTLGVDENGLLHVPLAMTSYLTPLLSNPLWGRLHPAVSRTGNTAEGRRELTMALAFTAAFATLAIVVIVLLREPLVRLAYAEAFLPAARLLPTQLAGDLMFFIAVTFGVYEMGIGRLRVYLACWVGYYVASAILAVVLLPTLGLQAVPVGYGLSGAALALGGLAWLAKGPRVPGRRTALLVVAAAVVLVGLQAGLALADRWLPLQVANVGLAGVGCFYFLRSRLGRQWWRHARPAPAEPGEAGPPTEVG